MRRIDSAEGTGRPAPPGGGTAGKLSQGWTRMAPKGSFRSQVLTLASGTMLGQMVLLLFAPVLTRLYDPADFASYALFMVGVNLTSVIAVGRYDLAMMLPEKDEDSSNLAILALALSLLVALGAWLAIAFSWTWLQSEHRLSSFGTWVWLVPVGLLANAWTAIAFKWETRKRRFHRIAWAEIGGCVGAVSTQLAAGLTLASPSGIPLICGALLGRFATLLIMCRGTCADLLHLRGHVSIRKVKSMAKRYWRFPALGSGALLLFSASAEVPKLMLGTLFLPQILGFYTISMRVVGSPSCLVSRAVGNVFLPRIAEIRHDTRRSRALILNTCGKLAVLASVPTIILLLAGERVFAIAFGEQWATAGHYARLLIPLFVARFVIAPLGPSLQVFEQQNAVFLWNFFLLGLSVIAFVIGRSVGGAETAILSYSLVTASMWVIYLGMCLHYAHNFSPRGIRTGESLTSPRGEICHGEQTAKETIHAPSVLA